MSTRKKSSPRASAAEAAAPATPETAASDRLRQLELELEHERSRTRDLELRLVRAEAGSDVQMTAVADLLLEALRDGSNIRRLEIPELQKIPGGDQARCWLHSDCSRTPGIDHFGERMRVCTDCTAFKELVPDPLARLQEAVNSVLFLLQRKQEQFRAAREQLIESEKLASLGELGAGLAHEINTPTGIILSRLDCMMLDQEMSDSTKEDLAVIRRHADRLRRITSSLTAFARRHRIEKRPVVLQELLNELLEITERLVNKGNVTISLDLPENPMTAFADGTMIQQVFMNIIINSRDAMPAGGVLTIRGLEREGEVAMEFRDTGAGIDETTRRRIFDPFFTTKEAKGTGLGLSVSYGIVKEHGGRIEVDSAPGEGATFRVVLPAYAPDRTETGP